MDKAYITVREACDRYGIGRTTVYDLLKRRILVAVKCGRATRLPVAENDRRFAALPTALNDYESR